MYYLPTLTHSHQSIDHLLNRVHHCDALDLLRALPDGSVDVLITDPPYGVGKSEWDKEFPTFWIEEAWRVTSKMLVMSGNLSMVLAANAIGNYRDCIVMHSRNGMTRSTVSFGNWFPVLVCGSWKWSGVPNYIPFNVNVSEKINHPSPKPLQAMIKLIEYYTRPNAIILDPFCGSGTTGLAARNTGRQYILGDITAEYVDIAKRRLAQPYTLPMFEAVGK
jgi:site-specific DNA-methyltransferase (adenine-specific)